MTQKSDCNGSAEELPLVFCQQSSHSVTTTLCDDQKYRCQATSVETKNWLDVVSAHLSHVKSQFSDISLNALSQHRVDENPAAVIISNSLRK